MNFGDDKDTPSHKAISVRRESLERTKVRKDHFVKTRKPKERQESPTKATEPPAPRERIPKGSTRSMSPSPDRNQDRKKVPPNSKVDLSDSGASQESQKSDAPPPTGHQERRPSSRQPRPKSPAIYVEMEKDELFKKTDPNQRDAARQQRNKSQDSEQAIGHYDSAKASNIPVFASERTDQRTGPKEKYKDRPVELVARGLLQKGASASSGKGPTKAESRQSSAEGGTRGRPKVRQISPPPRSQDVDQVWKDNKARDLRTPHQSPHQRAKSENGHANRTRSKDSEQAIGHYDSAKASSITIFASEEPDNWQGEGDKI